MTSKAKDKARRRRPGRPKTTGPGALIGVRAQPDFLAKVSPHVIRFRRTTLWHFDAGSGRRPPHQEQTWTLGLHRNRMSGAQRAAGATTRLLSFLKVGIVRQCSRLL